MAYGVVIAGLPILPTSPLFLAAVGLHVVAGLTCVASGAVAMLSRKGRSRHSICGTIYFWSLVLVFLLSAGLALSRWAEDWQLFVMGWSPWPAPRSAEPPCAGAGLASSACTSPAWARPTSCC
jgi:hypothetical protein